MKFCNSCGKCCFKTEMQLSEEDIQKIESNGWVKDEFCEKQGEYFQLKNIEGHCIFLHPDSNFCQIYDYRPMGCQFYPLIFDLENNQCIFDDDCPFRNSFYVHKPIYQKTCKNLRKWVYTKLIKNSS